MSELGLSDSLRTILVVFDSERPGAPLTTSEVASEVDVSHQATSERLERLVERDLLETKKVGAEGRIWWRPPSVSTEGPATPESRDPARPSARAAPFSDEEPDGAPTSWGRANRTRRTEAASAAARETADVVADQHLAADAPQTDFEHVDVGVLLVDNDGDIAWCNSAVESYFGVDRETIAGRDGRTVVTEQIAPTVADSEAFRDRVLSSQDRDATSEPFECRVVGDGEHAERWLEHRSEQIESGRYAGGRVELYSDITDRKRLAKEQADEQDSSQFTSLVEAVEEYAIFRLDASGQVQSWNAGAEQLKGYEADEIIGEHFSRFYTDPDREAGIPERNLAAAAAEGWIEDEGWRVRADGTRFWANVTITALRDDDGALTGFTKITRDMTERHEYERQLREETAFTESILENQHDVVYAFDTEGQMLRWNETLEAVTGYSSEEIGAIHPINFVADAAEETVSTALARVFDGESVTIEAPLETADGETVPYEFSGTPLTDEHGNIVGLTGVGRDISERKEKERQLERQREELEGELSEVFERIDDAFFALDDDWRFTHVNERAAAVLDRSVGELLGARIWDEFPAAVDSAFEEQYRRAVETQESVSFEAYFPPLETWFGVSAYPSETGLSVYFRDVTDRKRRERQLERYEQLVETVDDGIYALDDAGRYTLVNDGFCELTGYDREELLGAHASLIYDEELIPEVQSIAADIEAGERAMGLVELDVLTSDGESIPCETRFTLFPSADSVNGRCGIVRDISDRKAFEERLRALNQASRELLRAEAETCVGAILTRTVTEVFDLPACAVYRHDEVTGQLVPMEDSIERGQTGATFPASVDGDSLAGRLFETGESQYFESLPDSSFLSSDDDELQAGSFVPLGDRGVLVVGSSEPFDEDTRQLLELLAANAEAAWDRVTNEGDLRKRVRQQETVTALGQAALEDQDIDGLMADAAAAVADVLDTDYCKVLDLDGEDDELLLRQGVGWADGIVGTATVSATAADSQAAYTLQSEDPVVVTDLDTEGRFSGPDLLRDHDVRSGISVLIGPADDPWGILGTHDSTPRQFSAHDANFVQSVANILASAIKRRQDEQVLVSQREELAALVSLNEVVREISDAVIDQPTREEIEAVVCERLAAAESYEFAWIGTVDHRTQTLELEAEAGVENYLDDMTITVDPEDEHSEGPTGRALRSGEIQTCQDILEDPQYEPWREAAREYGFRSSAAVPITHDGTTYGVLNVYAERPSAFTGKERSTLEQLGEVVGHAIAAIERKRALMSDDVVELGFRIPNLFGALGVESADGIIRLSDTVPVGDGSYVLYGSVTGDADERLGDIVDQLPHWDAVEFRGDADEDGERRFELRVTEPPVLSTVASVGGTIVEGVVEDGHYHMTVQVPPGDGVRQVLDTVQEAYPDSQMVTRRQTTRDSGVTKQTVLDLSEELTDRQLASLRAAYHAGFFEWPRDASGEEVAESLEVAAPTFHQHLRKAEQKVFDSLLATLT
jgi:PAS domain S-box-containing protein